MAYAARQWRKRAAPGGGLLLALLLLLGAAGTARASTFDTMVGTWGGSGTFTLDDGSRERISCNAYYTGGGNRLGMVVRCSSANNAIEIRAKLALSGSRINGSWEERTYSVEGEASGRASGSRISLSISGSVSGSMTVSAGRSSQTVTISTQGLPLQRVSISLSRR